MPLVSIRSKHADAWGRFLEDPQLPPVRPEARWGQAALTWARQEPCPVRHRRRLLSRVNMCPRCQGRGTVDFRGLLKKKPAEASMV